MGFNLKILKMMHYFHDVICGKSADQTDNLADALVRKNVMTLWRCYEVGKFIANAILLRETQCMKMDNLLFQRHFQCKLG